MALTNAYGKNAQYFITNPFLTLPSPKAQEAGPNPFFFPFASTQAQEVFDEMPRYGVPRNVYSYTALINAYGKNAQYPRSLELLADMKRARIMPNVVTYNTIINACAKVIISDVLHPQV